MEASFQRPWGVRKTLRTMVMERVGQATARDWEAVRRLQGRPEQRSALGMKGKQQPRAMGLRGDLRQEGKGDGGADSSERPAAGGKESSGKLSRPGRGHHK